MYTIPPRTLKAPTGVWLSCFIHTTHPARWLSRGHEYCGVGGTNRWTSSVADSSSAKEGSVGIVATGIWIRCPVGQIGHIFEDLPNPLTTGTERAHKIITATIYLFAHGRSSRIWGAIPRRGAGCAGAGYMTYKGSRGAIFRGGLVSGIYPRLKAK